MTGRGNGAFERARMLAASGRSAQALAQLAESPELADDPRAAYLAAACHLDLGQHEAALGQAERALALLPQWPAPLELLGRVHIARDDLAAAERALLRGLAMAPDDADLVALYGKACALAGQADKARALVARARALAPDDPDVVQVDMLVCWLLARDRDAELRARELLALDPESRAAHVMLGTLQALAARPGRAEANIRTAVLADPRDQATADLGRELRVLQHWSMRPLLWVDRLGGSGVLYLALIGGAWACIDLGFIAGGIALGGLWAALAIWSWVAPRVARKAALG